MRPDVLVLAPPGELDPARRVWGTGGWTPPAAREALDWLVLARFLGWEPAPIDEAEVQALPERPRLDPAAGSGRELLIVAGDPEVLHARTVGRVLGGTRRTARTILVRPGARGFDPWPVPEPGAGEVVGDTLRWMGPGPQRAWSASAPLRAVRLRPAAGEAVWATLDGHPLVTARRLGAGTVVALGFHPGEARDAAPAATSFLLHLLVHGPGRPAAWLDFRGMLVLRMDDPGSSQNVHHGEWSYPELDGPAWHRIGRVLQGARARLSIAYTSGWVDDGDPARGRLEVGGRPGPRRPGAVHPSPRVRYRDTGGHRPGTVHDYRGEFDAIRELRTRGWVDVELHGHTHVFPDPEAWARASDRYENSAWYRELGAAARKTIDRLPAGRHPLRRGARRLRRWFGGAPVCVVFPGDEWTERALEVALDLDLRLVGSYYLALRHGDRFLWATHVCAPYLDRPAPTALEAELPVVGYFHDREPALEGAGWLARQLAAWTRAGARRFADFRELDAALTRRVRIEATEGGPRLRVHDAAAPDPPRPIPVLVSLAGRPLPRTLPVVTGAAAFEAELQPVSDGIGRVWIPPRRAGAWPAVARPEAAGR